MGVPVRITDHWLETVSDYILEQFRGASNWQAILKSVIDEYTDLEDEIWKLAYILDFKCRVKEERPSGVLLDFVAGLVNVTRHVGEDDNAFYDRFILELGRNNAGTPDGVIYPAALMSGDSEPQYMDEADATFFVYDGPCYRWVDGAWTWTEGGNQLTRAQVKKLAPAGVLGLPGAAIDTGDGILLGTYAENEEDRKILLVVANDSNVEREVLLADNLGNIVVTPQSVPVRIRLQGSEVPNIPTIETEWQGVPVDAVRIKDLPDAEYENAFMVRDSDVGGTTKINESEVGIQMTPAGTNTLKFFRRGPST